MPSDKSSTLNDDIVAAVDVLAEYQAIGFKPVGSTKQDGWQDGHALGREDRNASAGINVESGVYMDHGDNGLVLPMFKAIAQFSGDDWYAVRARLAKTAGLSRRLPKKKYGENDRLYDPESQLVIAHNQKFPPLFCQGLLDRFKITFESLKLNGGILAQYPSWSMEHRQRVIALPCYTPGPMLLKAPPRGYVLMRADGKDIIIPQKNAQPLIKKRITIGRSGLVGKFGLEVLQEKAEKIEQLFKVEGITDLLRLFGEIGEGARSRYPVITNSSGAGEKNILPDVAATIAACDHPINLCVIHDADEPGQTGAGRWAADVGLQCRWFRNIQLPYQVEEKHGKDLRDYFDDGNDFAAFQKMVKNHNPLDVKTEEGRKENVVTEDEENMQKINAVVLGYRTKRLDKTEILVYSRNLGKEVVFTSGERSLRTRFIAEFGGHLRALDANGQLDTQRIMDSMLALANRPADDEQRIGQGTWEIDGQQYLIGKQGAFRYKGDGTFDKMDTPILGDHFASYGSRPWFDPDILFPYVEKAQDSTWAQEQFDMISEKLFGMWTNLAHSWDSRLLTAICCACWQQPNWDLRPQVFISGETDTGKTILLERCFPGLFGRLAFPTGDTTKSGITQHVGSDSRIVLLDEFERSKERADIIKMFRNVTRGSIIARGTSSHDGYTASLRIIPIMAATERGKTISAADINRSIWLDLLPVPSERRGKLILPPDLELRDFGYRLHAISIAHWPRMKQIEAALKNVSIGGVESRLIECYGVLVAVMAGLGGLSDDAAIELLKTILSERVELCEQRAVDHEDLLLTLLSMTVRSKNFDCTVGQLIQIARDEKTPSYDKAFRGEDEVDHRSARAVLEGSGIKHSRGDTRSGGYASWNFQPEMVEHLLESNRTKFAGMGVKELLMRLVPLKTRASAWSRIKIGGMFRMAVRIPITVMSKFLAEKTPFFSDSNEEDVFDNLGEG